MNRQVAESGEENDADQWRSDHGEIAAALFWSKDDS